MNKTNSISLIASVVFLASCSGTHSPEYRNAHDRVQELTSKSFNEKAAIMTPERVQIGRINSGVNHHDINNYSLIRRDERRLPVDFMQPVSIIANESKPYTVDEFSAMIYRAGGIVLDVSSPDLRRLASEMSGAGRRGNSARNVPNRAQAVNDDSTGSFDIPIQLSPSAAVDDREKLQLKPFTFDGTIKEMLDYVALLNGLKWRYDPMNGKAFLYVMDTREFFVHDFGANRTLNNTINSSSRQSADSTGGGSSMQHSRRLTIDTWKQIVDSVSGMVGEGASVSADQKNGMILVTADDHTLSRVDRYIRVMNDVNSKPITLQYRMVRVKYNESDFKGINQNYLNAQLRNGALGRFSMEAGAGNLSTNISGNKGTMASLAQGNYLALANDSFQALMGFLNAVGTAELAYEAYVIVPNNEVYTHQGSRNKEYISSIQRSNFREGGGQENITTTTDVAVDGVNLVLQPRIAGDRINVNYSIANSDFISLDDAGLGQGLEGVKLKNDSSLFLSNMAILSNGQTEIIKMISETEETTSSQGILDKALWFLGGNESRQKDKSVIIMTLTAYYNN